MRWDVFVQSALTLYSTEVVFLWAPCNDSHNCKQPVQIIFTLGRVQLNMLSMPVSRVCLGKLILFWFLAGIDYIYLQGDSLFSLLPFQVCVHSHGSPGPAADGMSLPKHQPVCGELSEDGAQASGVRQTQPADPRNQLSEFPGFYYCIISVWWLPLFIMNHQKQTNKQSKKKKTGSCISLSVLLCGKIGLHTCFISTTELSACSIK